ncbi:hypothetical protein CUS_7951 [Ruminococcus albus 8]|uniref:Uncharacterized protein n=1 Tax=Ruminococcus albus 8 TaxID=246199 RepID=E9SAI9_RUMAL|nr:hypothetical protein CUS_7951 [Ruminococcus albus 8]
MADIFPTPQAGERYGALNYPFVYSIFSWCAKGIVIFRISPQPSAGGEIYDQIGIHLIM